jgi:hypothetical protein
MRWYELQRYEWSGDIGRLVPGGESAAGDDVVALINVDTAAQIFACKPINAGAWRAFHYSPASDKTVELLGFFYRPDKRRDDAERTSDWAREYLTSALTAALADRSPSTENGA